MSDRMGNNFFSVLAVEDLPEEPAPQKKAAAPKAADKKAPAKAAAPKAAAPAPAAEKPKAKAAAEGDFAEKPAAAARQHHVPREEVPIRPGKKVYERHSAPGRGRPAPKEGHNSWGTQKDEAREVPAEEHKEEAAPKEGEEAPAAAEEKEPVELDVQTFLKKREAAAVHIALPEARKAGEGVEPDPEWEKTEELVHDDDFYFAPKEHKAEKEGKKKEEKAATVSLSAFLADSRAGQQLATKIEHERRDRQRRERFNRESESAAPAPAGAAPKAPSPRPAARSPRARVPPAPRPAALKVDDNSFPSLAGGKKTPPQPAAAPAPVPAPAAAPAAQ